MGQYFLREMAWQYDELQNDKLSTYKRKRILEEMYELYTNFADVRDRWEYHPDAHFIKNRFCKRKKVIVRDNTFKDDGINYNFPDYGGLYLIGTTHVNPITEEFFYWVKVGRASKIASRMTSYKTCCPMCYYIDFKKITDTDTQQMAETSCHQRLRQVSLATCNHNKEWFLVDNETYLEICQKGFKYFT